MFKTQVKMYVRLHLWNKNNINTVCKYILHFDEITREFIFKIVFQLVGHLIKGGGIAITGQEQRQLGGGFLEGEGAPKGEKNIHRFKYQKNQVFVISQ